jgi:hypothetical protein
MCARSNSGTSLKERLTPYHTQANKEMYGKCLVNEKEAYYSCSGSNEQPPRSLLPKILPPPPLLFSFSPVPRGCSYPVSYRAHVRACSRSPEDPLPALLSLSLTRNPPLHRPAW